MCQFYEIRRSYPGNNWVCYENPFYTWEWLSGSYLSKSHGHRNEKKGTEILREMEMTVYYEGISIGKRRVDFFVEDKIMVELKAISQLHDLSMAQAINYLEAYNLPVGLLINFGSKSLEFKRIYNSKHPDNQNYKSK